MVKVPWNNCPNSDANGSATKTGGRSGSGSSSHAASPADRRPTSIFRAERLDSGEPGPSGRITTPSIATARTVHGRTARQLPTILALARSVHPVRTPADKAGKRRVSSLAYRLPTKRVHNFLARPEQNHDHVWRVPATLKVRGTTTEGTGHSQRRVRARRMSEGK